MQLIAPNIYVGNELDCISQTGQMRIIHACKSPCHQTAVGYTRSLSPNHPAYLVAMRPNNLYLNMVDMDQPQNPRFMNPMLKATFQFLQEGQGQNTLIHCNEGHSRGPSIGLLYSAKMAHTISNNSYDEARREYSRNYQTYAPRNGLIHYMHTQWNQIDTLLPQS